MNIKVVNLSNNKKQIIPECVRILNPNQEGKKPYAYFVWVSSLDEDDTVQFDFYDSASDKGLCSPFLYFTDYENLWEAPAFLYDDSIAPKKGPVNEYLDLMYLLSKHLYFSDFIFKPFVVICALCDCTGRTVPTGISPVIRAEHI